ncbi:MAG TPA: NAD(P)(+) transhydrogenase (Re/Si-specific) subunit beta [bacterium]|nr:NAD(P)(+) transhydrogenase (Re/Si-specific) subunit beta [bacterium]HOY43868.1 NAD(P)(+) transhydrogenase (Re/Si-specific) subunit beta [bacterium]HPM59296.1 NAD(P)(+) transhydrogenase (Re/Si-specific) subunit beta [bacterium]
MDFKLELLIDLAIILIFLAGFRLFRTPKGARSGNLMAAFALILAVVVVILRHRILQPEIVLIALAAGSLVGWIVAMRVNMIQIPAMVAFQHGAGGVAAFLVSFVELTRLAEPGMAKVSGILGLIIGAVTFSGSMIASGKLANVIKQPPVVLPKHSWLTIGLIILLAIGGVIAGGVQGASLVYWLLLLILLSVLLGLVFSIRIGGADMPVLISFLNATAGLAAALCGVIIQNRLLIACGATVAASGSILTHVMCKAMNRNLFSVFFGFQHKSASEKIQAAPTEGPAGEGQSPAPAAVEQPPAPQRVKGDPLTEAVEAAREAKSVIFIPGYGMALAQAQFLVVELAALLEKMGKEVKFAIHPVAGRMPGHMNVLLAEAELPYDKLCEMEDINPEFNRTDLAIVVGASDVVNPAAITVEDTPISGMPILLAHEAGKVLVCNLDERPGYSGIANPLYQMDRVIALFGDAKASLTSLIEQISGEPVRSR